VKIASTLVPALILIGSLSTAVAAHAQFTDSQPVNTGTDDKTKPRNNVVAFYPFTEFNITASGNGGSVTHVLDGSIIAIESGFQAGKNSRQSYAVGAWGFFRGDRAIIELHAKYMFTSRLGVQAGLLGATKNAAGLDSDYFALIDLSPRKEGKPMRFHAQAGLGLYAYQSNSAQFTGFIDGRYEIRPNLDLNASYWYVGSPFGGEVSRFAIGTSYRF
jgi:hypothetical protein